jgi:hypothetical protein
MQNVSSCRSTRPIDVQRRPILSRSDTLRNIDRALQHGEGTAKPTVSQATLTTLPTVVRDPGLHRHLSTSAASDKANIAIRRSLLDESVVTTLCGKWVSESNRMTQPRPL